MTWLTKSAAVLLLALWMPATMHCVLETMPGFSFLQYCCGGEQVPHTSDACGDDVCGDIESGLYKIDDTAPAVPVPALVLAFTLAERLALSPVAAGDRLISSSHSPPDLLRSWQFSHRAALSPRAPSSVV